MSDVIGRGVIEVSADAKKFKADIADVRQTIKGLGKDVEGSIGSATGRASNTIQKYVTNLQTLADTQGKSARETELYKLALRGASEAQLVNANAALKSIERYQQASAMTEQMRAGFITLASAAAVAAGAVAAGTIALIHQVGKYQDIAEKIGDTAVAVSSLKTASDVSGVAMDSIVAASVKLTKSLSQTDDEGKLAGAALKALGISFQEFKRQSPVQQMETLARAFEGFRDGSEKTAVAMALIPKVGADLLPFFKEYAAEGLKASYITTEQAKAADEYSDALARTRSQVEQFLQVSAVGSISLLEDIRDVFSSIANNQAQAATASDLLRGAMGAVVTIFQTIAVVGSDVAFVFLGVGRQIGAILAKMVALKDLDFRASFAISDAVREDAVRARAELDKFQAKVMAIGSETAKYVDPRILGNPGTIAEQTRGMGRPKLNTKGLAAIGAGAGGKSARDTAAEEAKAQLALDVEAYKKAGDAIANTIANSNKIIAAIRSAELISEADFYAEKRRLLQQESAAAETAVQQEIDRLQRENLAGKDKIDNDRKILDAQARLAKIRADASANLVVLGINEQASLTATARAYEDARIAAQAYLDVTNRARQAEVDSMGRGVKSRNYEAGIAQIVDKYEQQRQSLQRDNRNGKFAGRQADYDRELALLNEFESKSIASYRDYYGQLDSAQGDYYKGASEALANYYDEAQNTFRQVEDAVTNAFNGMEDALVEFVKTGKLDFRSLADSIAADIIRISVRTTIGNAIGPGGSSLLGLFGSIAGMFGGGGAVTPTYDAASGWTNVLGGRASGGPVSAGGMYRVNEQGPELLSVAGKEYLMMGAHSGSVTPAASGERALNVVNHFTISEPASRQTQTQLASAAARGLQRAQRVL